MKIDIIAGKVMHGWEPTDKRLGGTEDAILQWANQFIKMGHRVRVFRNGRGLTHPGWFERDEYFPDADVTLNVGSWDIPPSGPTAYFTTETNANTLDLSAYDAVVWPSEWADMNTPVNNPTRFIVPLGYNHETIYPKGKVKKRCLYASSPDRGLDTLERIWPAVVKANPDAELIVTYGGKIEGPNITCGEYTEDEMDELFRTSDIWVHPCNGGEMFCITGIKAQAAGAIPVYFPVMALQETVKAGFPCTDELDMQQTLIGLLDDEEAKANVRAELNSFHYDNWYDSAEAMLVVLETISDTM